MHRLRVELSRCSSAVLRRCNGAARRMCSSATPPVHQITADALAGQLFEPAVTEVASRGNILCLHGWTDNSASFSVLAPRLAREGYRVVALDFPGHGLSRHRPEGAGHGYNYCDYTLSVLAAVQALGWHDDCVIVGHSMGAGVATMVGGVLVESEVQLEQADRARGEAGSEQQAQQEPQRDEFGRRLPVLEPLPRLRALVLIEGLGPVSKPAADAPAVLLRHLHSRAALERRKSAPPRTYASECDAASARVRTVASHPGQQTLSHEAALAMVKRGTTSVDGDAVKFIHDPALLATVPYLVDEEAVGAYIDAIAGAKVPSLVFRAEHGWPFAGEYWQRRVDRLAPQLVQFDDASHHLHIDPESADSVADRVVAFLDAQAVR